LQKVTSGVLDNYSKGRVCCCFSSPPYLLFNHTIIQQANKIRRRHFGDRVSVLVEPPSIHLIKSLYLVNFFGCILKSIIAN